jgi:nuclease HARBI1
MIISRFFRFLLTPVREPNTDAQRRYNRSHIRTRNLVERTIGVLKRRFGCLSTKLKYAPQKVGEIVVVCCILHNYAIAFGDNIIFEDIVNENALEPPPPAENISGLAFRNAFIQQHFA